MFDAFRAFDATGNGQHGFVGSSVGPITPIAAGVNNPPASSGAGSWEYQDITSPNPGTYGPFNNIDITIDTDALVETALSGKGTLYPFFTDDGEENLSLFWLELNLIFGGGVVVDIEATVWCDGPFASSAGPFSVHPTAPGPFNDTFTLNMTDGVLTLTSAALGVLGSVDGGAGAFYSDWDAVSSANGVGFVSRAYITDEGGGDINRLRTVDFRGY